MQSRFNGKGGGVGFFIKNGWEFEVHGEEWVIEHRDAYEGLIIKTKYSTGKSRTIGVIYRPPGNDLNLFNSALETLLSKLTRSKDEIFLAGDYNIDLLKINSHAPTRTFFNLLVSYRLVPTILRPTRITQDSATLIDNIFTNVPTDHLDSAIITEDLSDHLPIYVITKTQLPTLKKPLAYVKRIVNDSAISTFNTLLNEANWSDVYKACDQGDANLAYAIFIEKYKSLYEQSFVKTVRVSKKRFRDNSSNDISYT